MTDDRDIYETLGRPPKLTPLQEFEIRQYREAGATIKQCAGLYEISIATVYRVLAKQRKKFGIEKLPNGQRARSYLTRREIQQQK